eukprot:3287827-Alexandrium_andersonii.AAC.1
MAHIPQPRLPTTSLQTLLGQAVERPWLCSIKLSKQLAIRREGDGHNLISGCCGCGDSLGG